MKDEINSKALEGEVIPRNKGGRPSKYNKKKIEELKELMAKGRSNVQICAEWGISEKTLYRWLNDKKEFKEAYDEALPQCQSYWEAMGEAGMLGQIKKFNPTLYLAFMNNKFNGWAREKKEEKTTQINIENMQVLQNMQQLDDSELDAKIQATLAKYDGLLDDGQKESSETD